MQYRTFGQYIKNRRISLGISQNNFANNCGIEPASLCRFENGKSDLYFMNIVKLANGFNVSPATLLSEFENFKE